MYVLVHRIRAALKFPTATTKIYCIFTAIFHFKMIPNDKEYCRGTRKTIQGDAILSSDYFLYFRPPLPLRYSTKVRNAGRSIRFRIPICLFFILLTSAAFPSMAQSAASSIPSPLPSSRFFDQAFPKDYPLRNIIEPIFLGKESFSTRLSAQHADSGGSRAPLGLVLCGGSARAYAHIGVLRALEAAHIYPDFIVASSMGAIVGMLYAEGFSPDDIQLLIQTLPLESYFNIVIPTNGGLINVASLRATIRAIIGDIDISHTLIPIIVTAEDLKTRQQIWIAEGPFDRAMTSAFAMPAIIEPQSFDRFSLIDAGVTTIAPVEPALAFSDRLIISTAFYDRITNFSSPLTVLNRAFDIGKTRAGMEQIEKANALVIRNQVENLSYMQFSDPELIIAKGEASAEAVLKTMSSESRSLLENRPQTGFFAKRQSIHEKLIENLQRLESGFMPSSSFVLRGVPVFKPFMTYTAPLGETGAEPRVGVSCAINVGKIRTSIGYFAAIQPESGKDWAIESTFEANPIDGLNIKMTGRLWGSYGSTYILEHNPNYWELSASAQNITSRGNKKTGFKLGGETLLKTSGVLAAWNGSALFHITLHRNYGIGGPRVFPWYSLDIGGFAQNSISGQISFGVEESLLVGLESMWLSPGLRAFSKVALNGQEFAQDDYDGFRSATPRTNALASMVTNLELAFAPQTWYLDVAEALLLRKFKLGPFFDTRWSSAVSQNFHLSDWAAGATLSFETRAFGLAPATMSIFASYSGSRVFSVGFRAGVLIAPQ